jgi:flagellar biosynthesis protein FlhB
MAEETGEKTEEPTPKRLLEARRRGEVAHSRDLAGAVVFAGVFAALTLGASSTIARAVAYLREALAGATRAPALLGAGGQRALEAARDLLLMPLAVALVAALAVGLLQTGGLLAFSALRLDGARLVPSLKRVLGAAALGEVLKGLVKVALAGGVAWATARPLLRALGNLAGASPRAVLAVLGEGSYRLGSRLVLAALALGVGDYLWQRHRHRLSLRMTRDQVKREHKESEGDPRHRAERQRLHRELLEQRMVAEVRKADFVVVNPDHIAVALRYDREGDAAPVVVARGERLLAEKIKEVAREAGVPIFRDVTLARSLRDVEEGDEIPEALYEAVAEILRLVYGDAAGDQTGAPPPQPPPPAAPPAAGWRRA